ncbi:MAG: hypothetical protein ACLR4Z_13725 [Butyricicoccaceae bacterium]
MPKYRVPIRTVLMRWAEDDEQLAAMARAAQQEQARRHDGGLPRGHPAPDILVQGAL